MDSANLSVIPKDVCQCHYVWMPLGRVMTWQEELLFLRVGLHGDEVNRGWQHRHGLLLLVARLCAGALAPSLLIGEAKRMKVLHNKGSAGNSVFYLWLRITVFLHYLCQD